MGGIDILDKSQYLRDLKPDQLIDIYNRQSRLLDNLLDDLLSEMEGIKNLTSNKYAIDLFFDNMGKKVNGLVEELKKMLHEIDEKLPSLKSDNKMVYIIMTARFGNNLRRELSEFARVIGDATICGYLHRKAKVNLKLRDGAAEVVWMMHPETAARVQLKDWIKRFKWNIGELTTMLELKFGDVLSKEDIDRLVKEVVKSRKEGRMREYRDIVAQGKKLINSLIILTREIRKFLESLSENEFLQ